MENNDSKKSAAASAEPSSADRRAFMKTVVTGTVAAGLVASVGKAEAAPMQSTMARTELPKDRAVKATILLNKNVQFTRDHVIDVIGDVFTEGHCPGCGFFGVPGGGGTIKDISIAVAYLPKDQIFQVNYQDDDGNGC